MERRQTRSGELGFTLVELLVALAVVAILMTGVYQFFISQQRTYSTQDEVARVQQQARMAIEHLSRTIQQTGAFQPQVAAPGGANIGGFTISLRGQVLAAASDRYLTLQYDDPYRPLDTGVITAPEVVTFTVSKPGATATETVDDGSGTGVSVYFDQNGNGEVEATENFTLNIPLALNGPPYTLYRITPDGGNPRGRRSRKPSATWSTTSYFATSTRTEARSPGIRPRVRPNRLRTS